MKKKKVPCKKQKEREASKTHYTDTTTTTIYHLSFSPLFSYIKKILLLLLFPFCPFSITKCFFLKRLPFDLFIYLLEKKSVFFSIFYYVFWIEFKHGTLHIEHKCLSHHFGFFFKKNIIIVVLRIKFILFYFILFSSIYHLIFINSLIRFSPDKFK